MHAFRVSQYQKTNRAARTAYFKEWRIRNIDEQRAKERATARRRNYGLADAETLEYVEIIDADPCVYCGNPSDTVDHIHPALHGGPNHWTNYAPACKPCNSAKRVRSLLDFMIYRLDYAGWSAA